MNKLIPNHGGYKKLKSYQMTKIIYDLTLEFCRLYVDEINRSNKSYRSYSRMSNQMIQAARSSKQNIVEGSMNSGTSKKIEIKLVGIARGSLEELLEDYKDFLRQRNLDLWPKDSPQAKAVRRLAYMSDKSYRTYKSYMSSARSAANTLICLIHQANYLLDQQLRSLENEFLSKGGFTEKMYRSRVKSRSENK